MHSTDLYSLLLLGIERKQVGDLIFDGLSLSMKAANFLCHAHDFSSKFFLELFDMG